MYCRRGCDTPVMLLVKLVVTTVIWQAVSTKEHPGSAAPGRTSALVNGDGDKGRSS